MNFSAVRVVAVAAGLVIESIAAAQSGIKVTVRSGYPHRVPSR